MVEADQRARLLAAMTDLVYEDGYRNVTVKALLSRAHVTKPTFYRLFSGKDDCLDAAHDRAVADALDWTETATAGCMGREDLIERGIGVFSDALMTAPAAANLALLEPLSMGDGARARLRRAEADFAALVSLRLSELDRPVALPPLLARGLVAGIARAARRRIAMGSLEGLLADVGDLVDWSLAITGVDRFDVVSAYRAAGGGPPGSRRRSSVPGEGEERAMLIKATTDLVGGRGYDALTVSEILATAGVSRARFSVHFSGLDDCFMAAVEFAAASAVAEALAAYRTGAPGAPGIARAIGAFTRHLAADPGVARLFFVEVFRSGPTLTERGAEILSGLAGLLRQYLPAEESPSRVSAEASVGAIWALIRHEVERGRAAELPRLSPYLTWFALAPAEEVGKRQADTARG